MAHPLISPNGTAVNIQSDACQLDSNVFHPLAFDDAGLGFLSDTGAPSGGTWRLFTMDDTNGNGGTISGWSITLDFTPAPAAAPPVLAPPAIAPAIALAIPPATPPAKKCKKKKKKKGKKKSGKRSASAAACKKKKKKKKRK